MDPSYFSSALEELSDTLKPYVDEQVSENLRKLVHKLQREYPNVAIQRYSILDEKSKPHCVAFDFELDLILYLHVSCNFDSPECLREIKEIVLTWDISEIEDILGGFQFLFQGITVNLLIARDMVLLERCQFQQSEQDSWLELDDTGLVGVVEQHERTFSEDDSIFTKSPDLEEEVKYDDAISSPEPNVNGDDAFLEDVLKLAQGNHVSELVEKSDDVMSGGSEVIFDKDSSYEGGDRLSDPAYDLVMSDINLHEDNSHVDEDNSQDNHALKEDNKKSRTKTFNEICVTVANDNFRNGRDARSNDSPTSVLRDLIKSQCSNVVSHIEEQTASMSDSTDRLFVVQNLGKRYSSSLIECYHDFFATQSLFCVSFIRVCKFWCLKVFLNQVHFGLLRYVEALAVYVCSRKQQSQDFHIIFLDFLLALKQFNSIRIDSNYYTRNRRLAVKQPFRIPYIVDVSFPYSNILHDVTPSDLDRFSDASDEFFRSMKNARCFRTELFSVQPYPAWLIDRIGVFHFIFQSSSELGIHISIQSTKKDIIPEDFLPSLSSRLYLWRQCAIADTRKHQAKESGSFYRAVSGLVLLEFIRATEAREVTLAENLSHSIRHKIIINFPDLSHENQVFRTRSRRKSFISTLICGRCTQHEEEDYFEENEYQFKVTSPQATRSNHSRQINR